MADDSLQTEAARIDPICRQFEASWQQGERPCIEEFAALASPTDYAAVRAELEYLDAAYRRREAANADSHSAPSTIGDGRPAAEAAIEDQCDRASPTKVGRVDAKSEGPKSLGRYRVTELLGEGGFGVVYRGFDPDLRREVAIKVPRRDRVSSPADAEQYLTEARLVARLSHPGIVPVHDLGRTDDGLCYVVSQFIRGGDLAALLKRQRPTHDESAELMAHVADALHYAHQQGLVHRDIKPGNILLDDRTPLVADFGLALTDDDYGRHAGLFGTPSYMSPEQARGEGHRVDARSDIYSLGVVFYELLTGRRPYRKSTLPELLDEISSGDMRPPRQLDHTIPGELERICLKTLAKRPTDRYTTAHDLAEDLRHYSERRRRAQLPLAPQDDRRESVPRAAVHRVVAKILPRGLRSFDEDDADSFLQLLPGPTDRDGLPESIRFWKARIEQFDADRTFSVGLLYGPSGCGKSSLMKAGLLPRLSAEVIAVYVEATPEETETRLLNGLRKRCPSLSDNFALKDTMIELRGGKGVPTGKKVLIVLDQFEQWLHAKKGEQNTELVNALRQCDGAHVQCVVMVRDDFWMAVTRFLTELEIELLQGKNCAAADLFDAGHAANVLTAFGRAFGKISEAADEIGADQKKFVNQAVSGLAQEGKVICVRLALFAEMMKGKEWTPAALKEVGGTEGIGVAFLEETFSSQAANPKHRVHQKAARAVLKSLLPESGTDIKGHMRSYAELLRVSGYTSRPREFDSLMRILDSELRLITPTDPELAEGENAASDNSEPGRYYQLTHDYLVPALRDWLTHKLRETRHGRAELLLEERTALWKALPKKLTLPPFAEWVRIELLTRRQRWTPDQRRMMSRTRRRHSVGLLWRLLVILVLCFGGYEIYGRFMASLIYDDLLNGLGLSEQQGRQLASPYKRWLLPPLRKVVQDTSVDPDRRLNAAGPILAMDPEGGTRLCTKLFLENSDLEPAISLLSEKWAFHGLAREVAWNVLRDADPQSAAFNGAVIAILCNGLESPVLDTAAPSIAECILSHDFPVPDQFPSGPTIFRKYSVPIVNSSGEVTRELSGLESRDLHSFSYQYPRLPLAILRAVVDKWKLHPEKDPVPLSDLCDPKSVEQADLLGSLMLEYGCPADFLATHYCRELVRDAEAADALASLEKIALAALAEAPEAKTPQNAENLAGARRANAGSLLAALYAQKGSMQAESEDFALAAELFARAAATDDRARYRWLYLQAISELASGDLDKYGKTWRLLFDGYRSLPEARRFILDAYLFGCPDSAMSGEIVSIAKEHVTTAREMCMFGAALFRDGQYERCVQAYSEVLQSGGPWKLDEDSLGELAAVFLAMARFRSGHQDAWMQYKMGHEGRKKDKAMRDRWRSTEEHYGIRSSRDRPEPWIERVQLKALRSEAVQLFGLSDAWAEE